MSMENLRREAQEYVEKIRANNASPALWPSRLLSHEAEALSLEDVVKDLDIDSLKYNSNVWHVRALMTSGMDGDKALILPNRSLKTS